MHPVNFWRSLIDSHTIASWVLLFLPYACFHQGCLASSLLYPFSGYASAVTTYRVSFKASFNSLKLLIVSTGVTTNFGGYLVIKSNDRITWKFYHVPCVLVNPQICCIMLISRLYKDYKNLKNKSFYLFQQTFYYKEKSKYLWQ